MDEETTQENMEQGGRGVGRFKVIALILSLLVLGGAGLFAARTFWPAPRITAPAPEAAPAPESTSPASEPAAKDMIQGAKQEARSTGAPGEDSAANPADLIVPLERFVVNLADPPPARRYMMVKIDAEMVDAAAVTDIQNKMDFIRDAVILLLSAKTSGDVSTLEGKLAMREEIARTMNRVLGGDKVIQVLYDGLVIE